MLPWGTWDRKVLRAARDRANASVTKKESSLAFAKEEMTHLMADKGHHL